MTLDVKNIVEETPSAWNAFPINSLLALIFYHDDFYQYCPTLTKPRIPMYLLKLRMPLYTLHKKIQSRNLSYIKNKGWNYIWMLKKLLETPGFLIIFCDGWKSFCTYEFCGNILDLINEYSKIMVRNFKQKLENRVGQEYF